MTNPCHRCVSFVDRKKSGALADQCSSLRRRKYLRYHYPGTMPNTNWKGEKCQFYDEGMQMTLRDVFKAQGKIVGGEK